MAGTKSHSIRTRVVVAFLLFAVLQSVLFFSLISTTGVLNIIYEQAYGSLNFRVAGRANAINELLSSTKSSFIPVARQINREINEVEPNADDKGQINSLKTAATHLIEYLNITKDISGVFIVLESENKDVKKDCVYIRDNSYGGYIRSADSKIYMYGPSDIAKEYDYRLFHLWEQKLDFKRLEENESIDFYTKPINAAKNYTAAYNETFYWSRPFRMKNDAAEIITFSLPLVDKMGKPFGVLGFEISTDFLKKNLPADELSGDYYFYFINDGDLNGNPDLTIAGTAEKKFLSTGLEYHDINNIYNSIKAKNPNTPLPVMTGIKRDLEIYNKNSVYAWEKWSLFGFTDENSLLQNPRSLVYYLVLAQVIILLVSVVFIIFITLKVTGPIKKLSEVIRKIDCDDVITLPVTQITEIDELTGAIQLMNNTALASASRLNTLIKMAGLSMGGFEVRQSGENGCEVFLTNSMSKLLGLENGIKNISKSEWNNILGKLGLFNSGDVCRFIDRKSGEERWLRLKKAEKCENSENAFLNESGVIMDVSSEIKELRKTQYERDYDSLTQTLNRRAFLEALKERIENGVYHAGMLVIIDLDNLKYINDVYSHEIGDNFLKKTARALKEFERLGGLISRIAGDEFMVFVPCPSPDKKDYSVLKTDIQLILERCKKKSVILPNADAQRLRFSSGIALYPADTDDIELLVKYADFAMLEVKSNVKGSVGEFNAVEYVKKTYIADKAERFELLIENEDFKYMFQPIVCAKTGNVFGYEMLIRSDAEGLKMPYDILTAAKAQSKLYYLEIIGLKNLFKIISENEALLENKFIFYNIIKDVTLKYEDWKDLLGKYQRCAKNAVVEISAEGGFDEILHKEREKHITSMGVKTALDKFGSGYSSETMLEKLSPSFIKINAPLIRDINLDRNKRVLVKGITDYCTKRGIKTVAVGIETYEEMLAVQELGIDYLQGFYLARPSYGLGNIPANIKNQILEAPH